MKNNENLKSYSLTEIEHLKVHGRTTGVLAPLTLFWTGSGIELNVKGSELWIEVEADYNVYEPWMSIVINSVPVSRLMLTEGRHWICVFRGMNGNVVKNVRIVRELQAMSGDSSTKMQIHAVKADGEFLPVEDKPYKIEFIGDSITSGEGIVGAKTEEDWIPMWFSTVNNYCTITAEALNADYRIIAQSGWGVYTSWDGNRNYNIPAYYDQVCGVLNGEKNEALGAFQPNDFAAWQPDVVVVNLGTNDGSALRLSDGTYDEDGVKEFEQAAVNFLRKLRAHNKHAHIMWAYGMLGTPMMPAIRRAVDTYIKDSGETKVSIIPLPNMTEETVGARWHPGVLAHQQAAEELARCLKGILAE